MATLFCCTEKPQEHNILFGNTSSVDLNSPAPLQSAIKGGWYLVAGEYSGEYRDTKQVVQFKLWGEKHFSFLMQSLKERWHYATTGRYELEADIYREFFEFSTNPTKAGITVEWNYTLNGDTLIMSGPTKIMKNNAEVPELVKGYNSIREVRLRAK